jgi:hypothetical protein
MGEVGSGELIDASLKDVWEVFFDPGRWPSWVDGFAEVIEISDGYPQAGGRLRWRSIPAGRGEVSEQVLEHEPRRRHRISFSDPESEGELETSFEIRGDRVAVERTMRYRILHPGLFGPLTDVFFVRRQVVAAMERELSRLKQEAEATG